MIAMAAPWVLGGAAFTVTPCRGGNLPPVDERCLAGGRLPPLRDGALVVCHFVGDAPLRVPQISPARTTPWRCAPVPLPRKGASIDATVTTQTADLQPPPQRRLSRESTRNSDQFTPTPAPSSNTHRTYNRRGCSNIGGEDS